MANDDFPVFIHRVFFVIQDEGEWVGTYSAGLIEADAMLLKI